MSASAPSPSSASPASPDSPPAPPSISQIRYWLEGPTPAAKTPEGATNTANTEDKGEDSATHLSYDVFLGLSVLGGFFGLDHLYVRSPTTFLAKLLVNIFCFGVWWLYDASQAIFNADVVKIYGLGIPGWGPTGIGAGVLASSIPDKKHMQFITYAFSLFLGGLIGLDSFIVGDRQTGIIRLLCLVSLIFSPIALLAWIYKLFQFFTNTQELIGNNYVFFGAPDQSLKNTITTRFPFLSPLFTPIETIKRFSPIETIKRAVPIDTIKGAVGKILGPVLKPVTDTAQTAIETVDHAVSVVDNTVSLGKVALAQGTKIIEQAGKVFEVIGQASSIIPGASLYSVATSGELKGGASTMPVQTGGAIAESPDNLNPLGYTLLGSFSLIAIAGFLSTVYRARNGPYREFFTASRENRNDTPPEPALPRKSDSKRSSA